MSQGRKVRRVIRRIDTWTVAKISLALHLCLVLVVMTAGVLLWTIADGQGAIGRLQDAVKSNLKLTTFQFHGDTLFKGVLTAGIIFAILGTFLTVVFAQLYNLLADLIGGIQVWVLEEVLDEDELRERVTGSVRKVPFDQTEDPVTAEVTAGANELEPEPAPV